MNTVGVLLLAAATATGGIGKPHAGGMRLLRHHAVVSGPAPAGGPINMGMGAATGGCAFGHPGCMGGETCPGSAGMGAGMPGGASGFGGNRRFPNVRSQVFFVDPPGMRIGWQTSGGNGERVYLPAQLTVPARYNFTQGYIYRLKITDIPNREGLSLYPTIEVAPSTPATDAFLTHNPIPVQFLEEDFDQVVAGNFVTKVIYLPDPRYQELAIAGVEQLVSTRLEPGVDPIIEADKRGTILMIVRLGAIDLEMPNPATMTAPGASTMPADAYGAGTTILAPGTLPPGSTPYMPNAAPPIAPPTETVPVDVAPVTPAPADAPEATTPPIAPPATEDPLAPAPGLPPEPGVVEEPLPPAAGDVPQLELP